MTTPNQVAIVTGASGNLGQVVCSRFLVDGLTVVRVGRNQAFVGEQPFAEVDLSDSESSAALVARVIERWGRLDIAVHTVGTYRASGPVDALDSEAFRFLFETNVMTSVNLTRAVTGAMKARSYGRVVLVSSTAALRGSPQLAAYSASKSAQLRLVESAAADLDGTGVTVNAVLPGTMDTETNRKAMPDADRTKWVSLDEVADAIAYLSSGRAAAVNGQALRISRER